MASTTLSHSTGMLKLGVGAAHLWCGISRGTSGKGAMNVFVSRLPPNKKKSGFPVGAEEVSDVQDLTTQPQVGLSTCQKTRICQQIIRGQP